MIYNIHYNTMCQYVKNIYNNIKYTCASHHNKILNTKMTLDEINELDKKYQNSNLFSVCDDNLFNQTPYEIYKFTYKFVYYTFSNIYHLVTLNDKNDKKYILDLIENNEKNLDMLELRNKTELSINDDEYHSIVKWISFGECWKINPLLTNCYKLPEKLEQYVKFINSAVNKVIPIDNEIILFHGFELDTNYNETNLKLNNTFTFKGILSKTKLFRIAQQFALSQNIYQPKYFIFFYPKKSKHVGLNIKPQKFDEYEYISKSNEKFIVKKICKIIMYGKLNTFYICDNLDYE